MTDESPDAGAALPVVADAKAPVAPGESRALAEGRAVLATIKKIALDPAVSYEKLEGMLTLQERILDRQAKAAFTSAMLRLQGKLPTIDRNGQIVIPTKATRDLAPDQQIIGQRTPYATWEDINDAILPLMLEEGFVLTFRTGQSAEGKITVTGVLSHEQGRSEETTITLGHDSTGSKNSVQAVGSSIQYGKRYVTGLLLNIRSRFKKDRDDDGAAAGAIAGISDEQITALIALGTKGGRTPQQICDWARVADLKDLTPAQWAEATAALERRIAKLTSKGTTNG